MRGVSTLHRLSQALASPQLLGKLAPAKRCRPSAVLRSTYCRAFASADSMPNLDWVEQLQDKSLFKQQCFIGGEWVDAGGGETIDVRRNGLMSQSSDALCWTAWPSVRHSHQSTPRNRCVPPPPPRGARRYPSPLAPLTDSPYVAGDQPSHGGGHCEGPKDAGLRDEGSHCGGGDRIPRRGGRDGKGAFQDHEEVRLSFSGFRGLKPPKPETCGLAAELNCRRAVDFGQGAIHPSCHDPEALSPEPIQHRAG